MIKKTFTVSMVVTATDDEFRGFKAGLEKVPVISELKVVKAEDPRIKYPTDGAEDMDLVEITFTKKVSKDQVEQLVEYWNSIGFVQGAGTVDWSDGVASFDFDASKSNSRDINSRDILEKLLEFLEDGTPIRKNFPYGQALAGLGKGSVKLIAGF